MHTMNLHHIASIKVEKARGENVGRWLTLTFTDDKGDTFTATAFPEEGAAGVPAALKITVPADLVWDEAPVSGEAA